MNERNKLLSIFLNDNFVCDTVCVTVRMCIFCFVFVIRFQCEVCERVMFVYVYFYVEFHFVKTKRIHAKKKWNTQTHSRRSELFENVYFVIIKFELESIHLSSWMTYKLKHVYNQNKIRFRRISRLCVWMQKIILIHIVDINDTMTHTISYFIYSLFKTTASTVASLAAIK